MEESGYEFTLQLTRSRTAEKIVQEILENKLVL